MTAPHYRLGRLLWGDLALCRAHWLLIAVSCLAGCGGLPLSPVTNDRREVHFIQDPSKTLTLMHDMTWYDGSPPRHELRVAAGAVAEELGCRAGVGGDGRVSGRTGAEKLG